MRVTKCGLQAVLWSHIGILILAAEPRCIRRTFISPLGDPLNDLANPGFDGEGLASFKSMPMLFLLT